MWYAVYNAETGRLVSIGTEVTDPLPEGLALLECGLEAPPERLWDPKTQRFPGFIATFAQPE